MRAVMISIHPKWCDLIASGKKTIEVRKTKPKLDTPFKCYIYCTQKKGFVSVLKNNERADGKVIGEFVCDVIDAVVIGNSFEEHSDLQKHTCLSELQMNEYLNGSVGYGWHISGLVIYDKPKELREFFRFCGENPNCDGCGAYYYSSTECGTEEYCCSIMEGCKPLSRPPQSWCYAEELK